MNPFQKSFRGLYKPSPDSHKGQNGRLLVIGGSKLFHSSIFWSADIASRVVDIVHFTSPANENNEIVRKKIKENYWSGIVVDWGEVEKYIEEDDCVLIGPGMVRDSESSEHSENSGNQMARRPDGRMVREIDFLTIWRSDIPTIRQSEYSEFSEMLKIAGRNDKTSVIVNFLLKKYPSKRWVIDGGALQEVDPKLITESCILTPHRKEFLNLADKSYKDYKDYNCANLSRQLHNCTIFLKGPTDLVYQGNRCVEIHGGNPGLTKGGTGDVLAGLLAALYCKNDAFTAASTASYVNKKAGEELYQKVGVYFNAPDLITKIPEVLSRYNSINLETQNANFKSIT